MKQLSLLALLCASGWLPAQSPVKTYDFRLRDKVGTTRTYDMKMALSLDMGGLLSGLVDALQESFPAEGTEEEKRAHEKAAKETRAAMDELKVAVFVAGTMVERTVSKKGDWFTRTIRYANMNVSSPSMKGDEEITKNMRKEIREAMKPMTYYVHTDGTIKSPSNGENPLGGFTSSDYLPPHPVTIGDTWIYRSAATGQSLDVAYTLTGIESFRGMPAARITMQEVDPAEGAQFYNSYMLLNPANGDVLHARADIRLQMPGSVAPLGSLFLEYSLR